MWSSGVLQSKTSSELEMIGIKAENSKFSDKI